MNMENNNEKKWYQKNSPLTIALMIFGLAFLAFAVYLVFLSGIFFKAQKSNQDSLPVNQSVVSTQPEAAIRLHSNNTIM